MPAWRKDVYYKRIAKEGEEFGQVQMGQAKAPAQGGSTTVSRCVGQTKNRLATTLVGLASNRKLAQGALAAGGRPSITIDGKRIPIASPALETFLDNKMKEARTVKKDYSSKKLFDEKFRKEFETILSTHQGVSEEGLTAMSRKLNIPIR